MIKLSGIIKEKFEVQTFNNFEKRTFFLEEITDKYPNTWALELWKKDCPMLDNYKLGDYVTCYIDIKGKFWENGNGKSGVINSLKCWNIEKDGKLEKEIK